MVLYQSIWISNIMCDPGAECGELLSLLFVFVYLFLSLYLWFSLFFAGVSFARLNNKSVVNTSVC